MRKLALTEESHIRALTAFSVNICLLEPTFTGLQKSILDATAPVRRYFLEKGFHDYDVQGQGTEHKIMLPASLLEADKSTPSQASLYRPTTKKGDPRIWFKGLPRFANPNDIIAIIGHNEHLYVLNLTQTPISTILEKRTGPIWELVSEINADETSIAVELLELLRQLAKRGPIESVITGRADTAIGRTLETCLGIQINSSKTPDYKGIELKSYRRAKGSKENRKTLFAQVANWQLSKFKGSKQILDAFGYARGDDFKLYCTVSSQRRNSQGLHLRLEEKLDQLVENSDIAGIGDFAVWLMQDLRARLLEKHNETFWVAAKSLHEDGREYFQFDEVLHTRRPIASQFDILLQQGAITMDHLIKRNSNGRVSEKGPLFKIETTALEMLFPPGQVYSLLS